MRAACERQDVDSGSIYTWLRQAMSSELAGDRKLAEPAFADVQISQQLSLPAPTFAARSDGVIGIELPSGIRVSADTTVDAARLTGQAKKSLSERMRRATGSPSLSPSGLAIRSIARKAAGKRIPERLPISVMGT